ncbi:MAG: flippase-like domain-containing protein [Vicinamibacterales bacterium]|nr:flippase-like domain-containing protein [Vicinamibacterales bacterium]
MRRRHVVLRAAVSIGLLAGLAWWLDLGPVVSRLAQMRFGWVLLAVAISVVQVAVLAWRWRFTAGCLGVDLSYTAAWREYYLSIFLNQVMPGGVVGDVSRAWRQARVQTRQREPAGPAVRAVIFERLSAQAVMTAVALVSLLALPVIVNRGSRLVLFGAGAVAVLIVIAMVVWMRRQSSAQSLVGQVLADLDAAHLSGPVFAAQLVSAAIVVGTYLATYLTAARAVGMDTPLPVLLPLVAPVLMSMLIPVTVAGWGLREGAAAVLWGAVGLTAADGVLVSVAYGLLVLIGSLPGALFLMRPGTTTRPAV